MRILAPLSLLAACATAPSPLPLSADGYRGEGDQCRLIGETAATAEFLDDAADLVACPEDMENLGIFALDTGGIEVARIPGYVLYSVPVR